MNLPIIYGTRGFTAVFTKKAAIGWTEYVARMERMRIKYKI
jgi:hypothetical protein